MIISGHRKSNDQKRKSNVPNRNTITKTISRQIQKRGYYTQFVLDNKHNRFLPSIKNIQLIHRSVKLTSYYTLHFWNGLSTNIGYIGNNINNNYNSLMLQDCKDEMSIACKGYEFTS